MSSVHDGVLGRVLEGDLCAGCGACACIAPDAVTMAEAAPGYLRPQVTGQVGAEAECRIAEACPGVTIAHERRATPDHPLWGPVIAARTGFATDQGLRHAGASGGGLSGLLAHLLESGAVEGVFQIAADPDNPTGNRTVLSRTRDEVLEAAGSRYAPSAPLADIGPHLEAGRPLAFVGKPCDVAALRQLARSDPRVDRAFPYMLSFFCAGVPSLTGAAKVVEKLGVAPQDLARFRYRGNGWPGFATATRHDGSTQQMSYPESWGKILSGHVQFRCKICPDGTGEFADIACADCWEADEAGYPVFEEQDGQSLIVSRTEKGEALLQAALAAGAITAEPFGLEPLAAIQPGQYGRRTGLLARLTAIRLLGGAVPSYRGFPLWRNARQGGLKSNLRNLLGTMRRLIAKRRARG